MFRVTHLSIVRSRMFLTPSTMRRLKFINNTIHKSYGQYILQKPSQENQTTAECLAGLARGCGTKDRYFTTAGTKVRIPKIETLPRLLLKGGVPKTSSLSQLVLR